MAVDEGATRSRAMVGQVSRLVDFLRQLARAGAAPVKDLTDYESSPLWLSDLPADLSVDVTAAPGESLATFAPTTAEPAPSLPDVLVGWVPVDHLSDSEAEVPALLEAGVTLAPEDGDAPPSDRDIRTAYDRWSAEWVAWAERDRATKPARTWYEQLSWAFRTLSQQDDQVELVLVTGLLTWRTPAGAVVRNHLLSQRLTLQVDELTGALRVTVAEPGGRRLHDRDLLDGEDGFDAARAEPARTAVRTSEEGPLDDGTHELLEQWRVLALPGCRAYDKNWQPNLKPDDAPSLGFAPAIVLRPRGRASLLAYYDQMSEALSGPDAEAPLGLAQLLTALEPEERLAWLDAEGGPVSALAEEPLFPLPANDEQRAIVQRLSHDTGVVVQGPPGTGKTHTIANLVSSLVAQGQRVLVTSQKAQALSVLREKLPGDVRELCVSMTEQGRGGSAELSRSVNALVDRHGRYDADRYAMRIADLVGQREGARSRQTSITEQIRALREAETYRYSEDQVAPGYLGTLGSIARTLRERADRHGWMPTPLPDDAPHRLPVSGESVGELLRLLAAATPARRARPSQVIPSASALLDPDVVAGLVATERAAVRAAAEVDSSVVTALEPLDEAAFEQLQQHVETIRTSLAGLLSGGASGDWRQQCLDDALTHRNSALWDGLRKVAGHAEGLNRDLAGLQLRTVQLPEFADSGPDSRSGQLAAGRALRAHAAAKGGEVKLKGIFRSAVEKQADLLLTSTVDDVRPTNTDLLDLVLTVLSAEIDSESLIRRWADVGHDVAAGRSLRARVSALVDAHRALERTTEALAAMSSARTLLTGAGVTLPLESREEWAALVASLPHVATQLAARAATAAVEEARQQLDATVQVDRAAPEGRELLRALATRDPDGYATTFAALADARVDAEQQRRADELIQQLNAAHPGLAQLVDAIPADPAWRDRLGDLDDAWAWGLARTFFLAQRTPGLEARLDRELAEVTTTLGNLTGELAATKAWDACLSRMTAQQSQALRSYQSNTQAMGKGTGRYAARYAAAARGAMAASQGAVPAWIMPLAEVLETVPPTKNVFDVVIIDEASQASIEALFLLWLAPRVIVVGDDKQCAPSQVAMGELQPIFDKLDSYLPDLPQHLRTAFTPRDSLFSLLTTRFGSVVRLREHFRCMPEIIDWSSRQFYADAPLVPLRQFGSDRLPPLRLRHVLGAPNEGEGAKLRNRGEAVAIADQIAACLADPAYDGKTFGVVVLQGQAQADLIEAELRSRVAPEEYERRRLRVGTPPDFQGDERHVVMLSLVVGPNHGSRPLVLEEQRRRFNVAASRAQDQMWLFHSVSADTLRPSDLRHSLLTHLTSPPAPRAGDDLANVTPDERHEAFDSLFEQRVYLAIRERGYLVTPQWEVNGRRIDLVVTGAQGRLAVECDGEFWHSTPEQRASDLQREQELKRAGWQFWRVRDSEFSWDPDEALEGLWTTLDRRGIRPDEPLQDV